MRTSVQYIKDRTGRFTGSVSLHPPRLVVPVLPSRPAPVPAPKTVPTDRSDLDLSRWDLATASDGLSEPHTYSSEAQRQRTKIVGVAGFITVNAAYVGSVFSLYTSSLPAGISVPLMVMGLPVAIALASIAGMPFRHAQLGNVSTAADK